MKIKHEMFSKKNGYPTWEKSDNGEWYHIGSIVPEEEALIEILSENDTWVHTKYKRSDGIITEYKFRKKNYPKIVSYEVVTQKGTVLFCTDKKEQAIKFVIDEKDDKLMVIRVTNQIIYENWGGAIMKVIKIIKYNYEYKVVCEFESNEEITTVLHRGFVSFFLDDKTTLETDRYSLNVESFDNIPVIIDAKEKTIVATGYEAINKFMADNNLVGIADVIELEN